MSRRRSSPGHLARLAPAIAVVVALVVAGCSSGRGSGTDTADSEAASPSTSAAAVTTTLPAPAPAPAQPDDPSLVLTHFGEARGTISSTADGTAGSTAERAVRSFRGLPFAAAPTGERRWALPRPVEPWTGTLDATTARPPCPQIIPVFDVPTGDEDCLALDVRAPVDLAEPAPVLVWIHGGGFTLGGTADVDPTAFVAAQGIVVVNITYRLGPLGFLPARDDDGIANLWLADQQAALRWVRSEIAAFGGDPERVTIAGESAGGASVCSHLVAPASRGLFVGAIAQSAPCSGLPPVEIERGRDQADEIAGRLGCPDAPEDARRCAAEASALDVVTAWPPPRGEVFGDGPRYGPVTDDLLPRTFDDAVRAGDIAPVPVLGGTVADEGSLFPAMGFQLRGTEPTDADVADAVRAFLVAGSPPEATERVLRHWPDRDGAAARLARIVGQGVLACPMTSALADLSEHTDVWQYRFEEAGTEFVLEGIIGTRLPLGAWHASEIAFVFGAPASSSATEPTPFTAEQQTLSDRMGAAWAAFVRDGDPDPDGGSDGPGWAPLSATERTVMRWSASASGVATVGSGDGVDLDDDSVDGAACSTVWDIGASR